MGIAIAFTVIFILLEVAIVTSAVVVGKKAEKELKEIMGRSDDE